MSSIDFKGTGTLNGGEYQTVSIDGVCNCTGDIAAEKVVINGVFKSKGSVQADILQCDGVVELVSGIKAKRIEVDGVVSVKGGTKIEASEIMCDGVISIEGEVSADVVKADGFISAKEIVGDEIVIKSRANRIAQFFSSRYQSEINLIEATRVDIRGVKARAVNGKDITIGAKCRIDTVDCSGTLYVDKSAVVGSITGDYTMRQ